MRTYFLNILFLFLIAPAGRAQTPQTQESILARAGYLSVTEEEFLKRYELLPGQYRHRKNNIEESKLVFLYSLVAEKLMAQEAEAHHLDQDSLYLQAIAQVKKNLVRDQLYREQIRDKVSVSRKEVQDATTDALRQLHISYLCFEDSSDAAFVRKQLKNCNQFHHFRVDSAMATFCDTVTLTWGEAEAPIEQAAFRLRKGDCSSVVEASAGYFILHLDREWQNSFYASMQPHVLFERVETKLRLRKEYSRLNAYLQTAFQSKTGFSLPRPFHAVAVAFNTVWKSEVTGKEVTVTDSILNVISERCVEILHDTMVVVGASTWSVEDVLNKLRGRTFTIDLSRTTGIAAQLNSHLQILVHQDLLAQEGLAQRLNERSSVKKELDIWRQQLLAKYVEIDFQRRVQVSDQDVFQYCSAANPEIHYPQVRIRELHTQDLSAMEQAMAALRKGESFEEVIQKRSSDSLTAQQGGLSNAFSIQERLPLGILAWRMNVGDRQGPLHLNNDYIYFELLTKEYPAGTSESSFAAMMHRLSSEARLIKQERMLNVFIAKSAQQRGYTIFADRLKQLPVSHVPMMTYRILGFGGRMFAAPFVTRQVDWVGVENPETIPLP